MYRTVFYWNLFKSFILFGRVAPSYTQIFANNLRTFHFANTFKYYSCYVGEREHCVIEM